MTNCTKYVVREMNKACLARELQEWLNSLYEEDGLEFVAVDGNNYIFKRNAYLKSIRHVETYDNDCESH